MKTLYKDNLEKLLNMLKYSFCLIDETEEYCAYNVNISVSFSENYKVKLTLNSENIFFIEGDIPIKVPTAKLGEILSEITFINVENQDLVFLIDETTHQISFKSCFYFYNKCDNSDENSSSPYNSLVSEISIFNSVKNIFAILKKFEELTLDECYNRISDIVSGKECTLEKANHTSAPISISEDEAVEIMMKKKQNSKKDDISDSAFLDVILDNNEQFEKRKNYFDIFSERAERENRSYALYYLGKLYCNEYLNKIVFTLCGGCDHKMAEKYLLSVSDNSPEYWEAMIDYARLLYSDDNQNVKNPLRKNHRLAYNYFIKAIDAAPKDKKIEAYLACHVFRCEIYDKDENINTYINEIDEKMKIEYSHGHIDAAAILIISEAYELNPNLNVDSNRIKYYLEQLLEKGSDDAIKTALYVALYSALSYQHSFVLEKSEIEKYLEKYKTIASEEDYEEIETMFNKKYEPPKKTKGFFGRLFN